MSNLGNSLVEGHVVGKKQWSDKLFSLEIEAPIERYAAGQFTKLGLLNDDGECIRRAYSMVNHPEHSLGTHHLEFLIIADDNGQLSPRLNRLEIGDSLYVGKQPSGFMTLDEIPDYADELWMLSTGTAIGPFLSMLEDESMKSRFKKIVLVHAVRTKNELVYSESIADRKEALGDRFHYVSVVSRENDDASLRGRVPELLIKKEIQHQVGSELAAPNCFVYICGNPAMVKDTSNTLIELGLTKHLRRKPGHFSSENYW
ncbi:ferredoxin--NADP reductase [uncultured Vibrio sp.]|uniref:ferredoxin--NADP reductase n=1 Tax=uncultured Vibrio sp. TaxID=114054 RepID=UPI0025F9DB2E|nr:ferredoxin--NADP reductase [uncultured Vibrio sp.]